MSATEGQRAVPPGFESESSVEIPLAWRAGRTAEQKAEILRRRAQALAKPLIDEGPEEVAELVTLDLGTARFAIETELVREVVSLDDLAPLPGAPDFVLGLLNVRGNIFAAIDLSSILEVGETRADWPQVIIVQTSSVEVAIAADACGMSRVTQSELRQPAVAPQGYVKATTDAGVAVLDLQRIIAETQRVLQLSSGRDAA